MWLPVQIALISAITAAVVTVVVEYAVKPRLEARKDRVVSVAKMTQELRVHLLRVVSDAEYLPLRKTHSNLRYFHGELLGCEHKARVIAAQRRRHDRIHQVLSALSSARHRLELLLDSSRKPYSDEALQEIVYGFYFAAARFFFRRETRVDKWVRRERRRYAESIDRGRRMIG